MKTPFDYAIEAIASAGYHNHRLETHSDTVSDHLFDDLLKTCAPLRTDVEAGRVERWKNVPSPGDRRRKADLFVGEPDRDGLPDISKLRIAVENKSVITAHRNRGNRFDDLKKVLGTIYAARPEAIIIGTVLIGLSDRVLNIPDQVHAFYRDREEEFNAKVRPRLSTGDATLWTEFNWAVSRNSPSDPSRTVELFGRLPTRKAGHTHVEGYDYLLLAPVVIDNVNPPTLPRPSPLNIDVDADYAVFLEHVCSAYTARWHM